MQAYPTVEENDDKEKIIGGLLTLEQGAYVGVGLMVGLGLGGLGWMLLKNVIVSVILALPPLAAGGFVAFVKFHGMSIPKYYQVKKVFDKQVKNLPNCRPQYIKEVKDPNKADMLKIYEEDQLTDTVANDDDLLYRDVLVKKSLKREERKEMGLLQEDEEDNGIFAKWKKLKQDADKDTNF